MSDRRGNPPFFTIGLHERVIDSSAQCAANQSANALLKEKITIEEQKYVR